MGEPAKEIDSSQSEIWELIRTLVLGQASAARILELYYWSQDEALLAFVRTAALMPEQDRQRLFKFFSEIEPRALSIAREGERSLVIHSNQ